MLSGGKAIAGVLIQLLAIINTFVLCSFSGL